MHTSNTLYTMDVDQPYTINQIGPYTTNNQALNSVTDIAIDRWGVLYAETFSNLYACDPETAECWQLAQLPQSSNGLTMIPPGIIDQNDDTLVAIAGSGAWFRVDVMNGNAMFQQIGQYGQGLSNAGDVFSIEGVGTYGATNPAAIWECDPTMNNKAQNKLTDNAYASQYGSVWGLAGWEGKIFAFNSDGKIALIDPQNGDWQTIHDNSNPSWWGAGVWSVLPQ
jgi:hypothetical protein